MGKFRGEADWFFRVLALSLAAMAALLLAVTAFVNFGTPENESSGGSVYLPEASARMNLLLIGRQDGHTDLCVLLGFLPDKGFLTLAALPPSVMMTAPGANTTLAAAIEQGGARYAADLLAQWLEIPIDRTAVVDEAGFSAIMAAGGPVDFELTLDLDATLRGRRIQQNRGVIALTGRSAADLMLYPAYPRGENQRSDMTVQLLRAVLSHHLPGVLTETAGRLFTVCLNQMETDLAYLDYETRRAAAQFLARLEKNPVTMAFIDGAVSGGVYYLTRDAAARLRTTFAPPQTSEPAA